MPARARTADAGRDSTAAHAVSQRRVVVRSSAFADTLRGITLAALRVMSALILLQHMTQRTFGVPLNPARPWTGAPDLFTRPWFTSVLELVGGTLLLLGLSTRPVAFVLSGLMAFAYFLAHADESFWPIVNRGEPAVLLCFVFLYFAAAGAGPYSLDAMRRRRREAAGEP
jgi:putative oxidoreductase